jgi:hypothetical protein
MVDWTDTACYGDLITITPQISGGSGDYTYEWSDGSTSTTFDYTFDLSGGSVQQVDFNVTDNCTNESFTSSTLITLVDNDQDGICDDQDNCPNDYNPNQEDSDGDEIGDECDDCHNLLGDINDDQIHDILDIVNIVNLILDGGMSSDEFSDCEKGDSDLNEDGIANILDKIKLIN